MGREPNPLSYGEIGRRLWLTREALGLNQTEFCERAGIKTNAYNQWEHGTRRPTLENALALHKAFDLTLDWIYLGRKAGLPHELATKIEALEGTQPVPTKGKRGRKPKPPLPFPARQKK